MHRILPRVILASAAVEKQRGFATATFRAELLLRSLQTFYVEQHADVCERVER
jgi:hypothetical protein